MERPGGDALGAGGLFDALGGQGAGVEEQEEQVGGPAKLVNGTERPGEIGSEMRESGLQANWTPIWAVFQQAWVSSRLYSDGAQQ